MVLVVIGDLERGLEDDKVSIIRKASNKGKNFVLDLIHKGTDISGAEIYYNESDANDLLEKISNMIKKDNLNLEVKLVSLNNLKALPHGGYKIYHDNDDKTRLETIRKNHSNSADYVAVVNSDDEEGKLLVFIGMDKNGVYHFSTDTRKAKKFDLEHAKMAVKILSENGYNSSWHKLNEVKEMIHYEETGDIKVDSLDY